MEFNPELIKLSVNDPVRLRYLIAEALYQVQLNEGDFIELGVFMGGSAALLASVLRDTQSRRCLHLLDSWEGLPPLHEHDAGTFVEQGIFDQSDEALVKEIMRQLGLENWCRFYKGWFKDTLPALEGPFALAHVDCDLYEPVCECLNHLLPRMTTHGVIVVDDFGTAGNRRFPGVEKAVSQCIAGSKWVVCPLGGERDQSIKLVRTQ
ncbi:MAG: TylF/MycF family methyltransferase [Gammaproteobacteria bacterium]|nr:TylF/MycF family methyltransferase [Gammaproteobacteria bacterium]